ncbi:hypothetical protein MACK_001184 [Theileria orientalis]|uniref:Uncharacterized protein n=1 Tax=Theileria orientalis TaxID=68886 RepID=A0A976MC00_THEOR|nr:hypothetical protein MACK_001184 [Theileria orientalis]
MIKIYLAGRPDSSSYVFGNRNIEREDFPISNIFYRYKHHRTGWLSSENIEVCEQYSWSGSCVTLKATGVYEGYSLTHQHVYFNKYNDGVPLVLVLFFSSRNNVVNKFYRLSNVKNDLGKGRNIEELDDLTTEENLLNALIEENDKIDTILTYDIGLTEGNSEDKSSYNGNKIKLTKLESNLENEDDIKNVLKAVEGNVYRIYRHTSKPLRKANKFCYIYKKQVLMNENKQPIKDLMSKNYNLTVYFGVVNKPLLVEFYQQNNDKANKLYYYLNESSDGTEYWDVIKTGSVLDVEFTDDTIYEQLTSNNYDKLLKLLEKLKNKFTKTIFFMLDAQEYPYQKIEIGMVFDDHIKYNMINDNMITVEEKNDDSVKCITSKRFKVFEHDFRQIVSSMYKNELAELKFIIPNGKDKHTLVNLYKDVDAKEMDSLMCTKGKNNSKLYTYFYGHDPRILLICYNGLVYRPKDLYEYEFKWVKEKDVNSCFCNEDNNGLLNTLTNIISFLTVVNLNEKPDPGSKNKTYDVHKFGDQKIQITVNVGESVGCYKVYVHEPNKEGYRLGNIEYRDHMDQLKGKISYEQKWNAYGYLGRVIVYYYNRDEEYRYPLLVVLEFKNNHKSIFKQYQLTSSDYKWSPTYGFDLNGKQLLPELYTLNKKYNLKEAEDHESECLGRNKHIRAIIGTVVPTTLVTGGIAEEVVESSKTPIELSLNGKSSKNKYDYNKSGNEGIYTTKDGFGFCSIKLPGGCCKSDLIWQAIGIYEYADKVIVDGNDSETTFVKIFSVNGDRKLLIRDESNEWDEFNSHDRVPVVFSLNSPYNQHSDQQFCGDIRMYKAKEYCHFIEAFEITNSENFTIWKAYNDDFAWKIVANGALNTTKTYKLSIFLESGEIIHYMKRRGIWEITTNQGVLNLEVPSTFEYSHSVNGNMIIYTARYDFVFVIVKMGHSILWKSSNETGFVKKAAIILDEYSSVPDTVLLFFVNGFIKHLTMMDAGWTEIEPSIVLNIDEKYSKNEYRYIVYNKAEHFVPIGRLLFRGVRTTKGWFHPSDVDIWIGKTSKQYAKSVMIISSGKEKYMLLLLVDDHYKLFFKSDRITTWTDYTHYPFAIGDLKLLGYDLSHLKPVPKDEPEEVSEVTLPETVPESGLWSRNLIDLDITKMFNFAGYTIEYKDGKVIFKARFQYLFKLVLRQNEILWKPKIEGEYPYKVVYKEIDNIPKIKVYLPDDNGIVPHPKPALKFDPTKIEVQVVNYKAGDKKVEDELSHKSSNRFSWQVTEPVTHFNPKPP